MLSPVTRSVLLLSLFSLASFPSTVHAFPQLAGLTNGHQHSHAARSANSPSNEEVRRLHIRQLQELTGLLGAVNTGSLPVVSDLLGGSGSLPNGPPLINGRFDEEKYPFIPPTPDAQRGPCPAQNALANHGVINRSGIVSAWEVLDGVMSVFNLGYDIALVSVLLAAIIGGDPVAMTYSIGGPDKRVGPPLGGLLGVLGQAGGLDYTHNIVEVDSSLTRHDLYDTGNCWTLDMDFFMQLYNAVPEGDLFTHEAIAHVSCVRWHQSVATSPNFYYGPGTGYFRNMAQMGLFLWSNHSDGSLDGQLTHEILYSMYGMTDENGPFTYKEGWERLPRNWWPRPQPFYLLNHLEELLRWFGWCPALASIGGNTGAVNTFTAINFDDPVSGIENLPDLLNPTNLICFVLEMVRTVSPGSMNNIYSTVLGILGKALGTLACPVIPDLTRGGEPIFSHFQSVYPGARLPQ